MNTAAHPVTPEEVMALLDGELLANHAESLSAHIERCAECQRVATTLEDTAKKLAAWTADAPERVNSDAFLAGIKRADAKRELGKGLSGLRKLLSERRVWVPALSLGIVLVAFLSSSRPKMSPLGFHSVDRAMVDSSPNLRGSAAEMIEPAPSGKGGLGKLQSQSDEKLRSPMIARTAALSIVVKDFDVARASVDATLARRNGYAAAMNVATPQGAGRTLRASLRIPARQLVAALAELKALGRVELETQNGEEVTQQHADLVARLKNSRETEQRLQAILLQRTGKISDVLSVEQEIARVRGEIEQMEAEAQTLEHRVDFATIDLQLAEEYKAQLSSPALSVVMQLRNAGVNGFRSAFVSLLALLLFLAESGPTLLLWLALLGFPAWLAWRRYLRSLIVGSPAGV